MEQKILNYYRARYYDPTIGRFITPDPIGFMGGDTNFYRYVGNDPVNYTDPSGLSGTGYSENPSENTLSSLFENFNNSIRSIFSPNPSNPCATMNQGDGCMVAGAGTRNCTITNAYFAEQAEREVLADSGTYKFFSNVTQTTTAQQKTKFAKIILKNIKDKTPHGEKYPTEASIKEALTKESYNKGETITFKRFKKEKYSKRINEASIGQKVTLVATLSGCPEGQNVTFKIYEKSPMLMAAGKELVVLKEGAEVTEVTVTSQGTYAVVEVELRPKKDKKANATDTAPSLELWQEKFKHAPNTPEKFDHLWLKVSSPSAKNTPQEYLKGEELKVKNQCFNVDKFIEEYKIQFSEQILTQNIINNIKTMLKGAEEFYTQHNEFECKKQNLSYIFATARLETNETFGAVEEAYWISESAQIHYYQTMYDPILGMNQARRDKAIELGNTQEGDGVRYHGRGYCQITGKTNYSKAGEYLGIDLINNPNMAKEPENAIKIILYGMHVGLFTGKKLSNYIIGNTPDYYNARKIINGLDRANDIKGYAIKLEECFKKGMNS